MSPSISPRFCYIYTRFQALSAVLLVLLVQVIMQLRLFAIYGVQLALPTSEASHTMHGNRTLPFAVTICWGLQIAGVTTVLALAGTSHIGASTAVPPGLSSSWSMCTPTHIPHFLPALWLPVLAFELLLVVLAAKKGFVHIVQFARYGDWWCPKMLAGVMVRDSMLYFLATFSAYAVTAILWWRLPPAWIELPEGACVALTSILGARLVLNLREAYHQEPSTAVFSTATAGADIGWTPKTPGKTVSPMWPRKPLEQRMAKKARQAGALDSLEVGIGDGRRAPPPRRRGGRGVTSELAFASPRRGDPTASTTDFGEGDYDPLAPPEPVRTRPGNRELDDMEGSPTTAVGSNRRWHGSFGTSAGSTASAGTDVEMAPRAWISEETLGRG
jgi:hypothetical protein